MKGEITMSDNEKFEGFKQKLIDDNERQYGAEIREKYGEAAIDVETKCKVFVRCSHGITET
jgi:hypothetical protein